MEARKPISSDRSISSHKAYVKEYLVSVKKPSDALSYGQT